MLWSGIFLILGGILVGAAYFVLYSDFFKVESFEIVQSRYTPDNVLLTALDIEMIARSRFLSILGTDNILFWEFGKKPETLTALPLIARISVETDLTARKVLIKAEERDFLGIWCLPSGDCYAFDDEGIIFARAPEAEGALILKVTSENDRPVVLGNPIFVNPAWRNNFFQTLEIIKKHGLVISRVTVKDFQIEEWEIKVAEGPVFQFNFNFTPPNLGRILENLDDKFELDRVTYFDFRVENRIYYE